LLRRLGVAAALEHLCSSYVQAQAFASRRQLAEIPRIDETLEIPVISDSQIFRSGKELLFISAFWTVWQDFL
jgi:hypothetical protein